MKHDKSQVVLYQLLYVWIKCSKFCKHFPIYFYTSQNWKINQSINQTQGHISQIWTFLGHAFTNQNRCSIVKTTLHAHYIET